MELTFALVGFAVVLLVVLFMAARQADQAKQNNVESMMDRVLSGRAQKALDEIARIMQKNSAVLGHHRLRSQAFRTAGRYQQAAEYMASGCKAIEALAPDYHSAIRTLQNLARSASVIVNPTPLRPHLFRSWELRGVMGLGVVAHHLLVTGQERVRLRLRLLSFAFGMSVRWLQRAAGRVQARPSNEEAWTLLEDCAADIETTGDETVLTATRIIQALAASAFFEDGTPCKLTAEQVKLMRADLSIPGGDEHE